MKKWDQGLTAFLLLALAAIIAVGVPIGWAFFVTTELPKAADWIAFAGSVAGALMTLVAAVVAWRAVQAQIEIQREAVLLGVLTREEDRVESEIHALEVAVALLIQVKEANRGQGPGAYWTRLSKLGITTDYSDNRDMFCKRVPAANTPNLAHNVAWLCANLAIAVVNWQRTGGVSDGAGGVIYTEEVIKPVADAAQAINDASVELINKRDALYVTRSRYRERIASALANDPTSNSSPVH